MMSRSLLNAPSRAALVAAMFTLAACGGGASGSGSGSTGDSTKTETLKIGGLYSQTGPFGDLGKSGWGGLQVAIKDVNADGITVGGTKYKIELTELDSQSKTDVTTANALQLSRDNGIKFVFGPDESADALVAQAQTFKQGAMYFTSSGSISDNLRNAGPSVAPNGFSWTISGSATAYGTALAKGVLKALPSSKSVAIMATNAKAIDAYVNATLATYQAAGVTIPNDHVYRFDPTTTDFTPILTRIKAYVPDTVYVLGSTGATNQAIAKQMVDLGNVGGSLAVLGSGAAVAQKDAIGGPLPYPYFYTAIGNSDFAAPTPAHKTFLDRWKSVTGYEIPSAAPSQSAAYYAPLKALVAAMQKAGSVTDVDKIQTAMVSVSGDGPIGPISFSAAHRAKIALVTCQVKSGKVTCAAGTPNDL
jgi:branched-chain amino acid transport system substrate-binding protein